MIRGDNIICGTTTTGTGTLTLAATPVPPGGVDFDVFARATGIGFGNSAAVLVSYTIIEYTDATFATAKQHEKGVGTLTLGGSSGIANATLARTTLQTSATSLNAQPATQNIVPGTGITIGTAANTLIFIGASAADTIAFPPYVQSTFGGGYAYPMGVGNTQAGGNLVSGTILWNPFVWAVPMLVHSAIVTIAGGYTGGTPVSNADLRLYAVGTDGRPGKLLLDFGLAGSAGASLNASATITATASGSYFLIPGVYWFGFVPVFSGGTNAPTMIIPVNGNLMSGVAGAFTNGNPLLYFSSTGGTIGAAPDPDPLTSWTGFVNYSGVGPPTFAFHS